MKVVLLIIWRRKGRLGLDMERKWLVFYCFVVNNAHYRMCKKVKIKKYIKQEFNNLIGDTEVKVKWRSMLIKF